MHPCVGVVRLFDFEPAAVSAPTGEGFRKIVCAVAGMSDQSTSSLLSSLPNELCFNDLRDAVKRSKKQEKTHMAGLHCVSVKSALQRNAGCKGVALDDSDWSDGVHDKQVRATIFSSLRASDRDLGISCSGLTRHRNNSAYTKPHIFAERLRLFDLLECEFHQAEGDVEKKTDHVLELSRHLWLSQLVPGECFLKVEGQYPALTLRSGPHSVLVLQLRKCGSTNDVYTMSSWDAPRTEVIVKDHASVEIAFTKPVVVGTGLALAPTLAWQQEGDYITVLDYVADHAIKEISASKLSSLCARIKLQGHGKLDHRHRVELFLKHMKRSESWISEVLEEIRESRKKKADTCHSLLVSSLSICFFSTRRKITYEALMSYTYAHVCSFMQSPVFRTTTTTMVATTGWKALQTMNRRQRMSSC